MSDAVVLTLRAPLDGQLDLSGVTPDRCADLSTKEVAALPIWQGGAAANLGDVFDVRGERAAAIEIEGDLSNAVNVGARMTGGTLRGDAIGVDHRVPLDHARLFICGLMSVI